MKIETIRKQVADSLINKFGNNGLILLKETLKSDTYTSKWQCCNESNIMLVRVRNATNPKSKIYVKII